MRTDKEIKAEITKLEELQPHILKQSFFGEDHRYAISETVLFLRGIINPMETYDVTCDEFNELPDNVRSAVSDAESWAEGQTEEAPSKGWEELDQRKKK